MTWFLISRSLYGEWDVIPPQPHCGLPHSALGLFISPTTSDQLHTCTAASLSQADRYLLSDGLTCPTGPGWPHLLFCRHFRLTVLELSSTPPTPASPAPSHDLCLSTGPCIDLSVGIALDSPLFPSLQLIYCQVLMMLLSSVLASPPSPLLRTYKLY